MSDVSAPERALRAIVFELSSRSRAFALVGGLAISIRAEVRFTRDVDVAVAVEDDADAEALVRELAVAGYRPLALVSSFAISLATCGEAEVSLTVSADAGALSTPRLRANKTNV